MEHKEEVKIKAIDAANAAYDRIMETSRQQAHERATFAAQQAYEQVLAVYSNLGPLA